MDFAALLRDLMREQKMTGRGLARKVPCDPALISRYASGQQPPSERMASRLDELLGAVGALTAAAAERPGAACPGVLDWWVIADYGSDDVNRRDALGALAGGPVVLGLERLRRNLDSKFPSPANARDADEWERIAWGYAEDVPTTPPGDYLPDLLADASEITARLGAASGQVRERLVRSAAKLAGLTAIALTSVGEYRTAARWWRTAARVGEESQDPVLTALISGNRAVFGLYSPRPAQDVLGLADRAVNGADGVPCAGLAEGLSARAQALAMLGRHGEASVCLNELRDVFPQIRSADEGRQWAWPEQCLRHVESWVMTRSGNLAEALSAQEAALALYPQGLSQGRMQVELHRAEALIRAGDVTEGVQHVTAVLSGMNVGWRADRLIASTAVAAITAIPKAHAGRPDVREARELLALPAGA